jgi:hypothetical protein
MIRKWSYLNYPITNKPFLLNKSFKSKSFKVFKQTTKFKKFKKGLTQSVRQKYTYRKFSTSNFVLPQITKWWSFNYIQTKQINRFYQSFLFSPILSNMPDYSILPFQNYNDMEGLSMHLFSCTKRLIFRLNGISKTLSYSPKIKNSKISFTQTTNITLLSQSNIVYPLSIYSDNLSYDPVFNKTSNSDLQVLLNINNTLLSQNLRFILVYYKIIVLYTLLYLENKK